MAVAESHSPGDELLSSSPGFAASRFTPESSSSNISHSRSGSKEHGYGQHGARKLGMQHVQVTDGIEAYELRDIMVIPSTEHLPARGGASITDGDGEHDDKEEGRQSLVYTAEEERAVVKKFDRRLVLFVALLYMLSFLDRSSSFYPPLSFPKMCC